MRRRPSRGAVEDCSACGATLRLGHVNLGFVMSQLTYKNVVGPKIRSLRIQFAWTQEMLASALRRMGWDISRSSLAKIEARLVHVSDSDLLYFVRLFEVEPIALYPELDPAAHLGTDMRRLLTRGQSVKSEGHRNAWR